MPTSICGPRITVEAAPLTRKSFVPFGTVIAAPLPPTTTTIPSTPPPHAVHANQKTALKYVNISPLESTYHLSSSSTPAHSSMSLFSCFPHELRSRGDQQILDLQTLERHPFTTQTFVPISSSSSENARAIIIVAPTLPSPPPSSTLTPYYPQQQRGGPPDLSNVRAFVAEPGMGVTYAAGTWHAPMVVIGEGRLDFVVTQWVNGREEDDCQEMDITEGLEILIDVRKARGRQGSRL